MIGASWATCFLARGLNVRATDPAPNAEAQLRLQVQRQWSAAASLGLTPGASIERLQFCSTVEEAVHGADFVQENGPERLEFKRSLFAQIDAIAPSQIVLASSSSGIPASAFQAVCQHPERVLIAHPFNPPHLIPLVEVVGGMLTSPESIDRTMEFFRTLGKRPIQIRQERKGFVTNRLQAALWREAYGLVQAGVASVEDIDTAIANGPGLRWALLGPFATQALSGGAGGMAHVLEHLGPPMDEYWQDLLPTRLTNDVKAAVLTGTEAMTRGQHYETETERRDALLVALLQLKAARERL